jgi:hypothetical protein
MTLSNFSGREACLPPVVCGDASQLLPARMNYLPFRSCADEVEWIAGYERKGGIGRGGQDCMGILLFVPEFQLLSAILCAPFGTVGQRGTHRGRLGWNRLRAVS